VQTECRLASRWLAVRTGTEMGEHGSIHVLDDAAWQGRRREFAMIAPAFLPWLGPSR
jgi:hypothetical protein